MDLSPEGDRVLVDTISGPFEIYPISTSPSAQSHDSSSPSSTLTRPREYGKNKNIIRQGVFAENGTLAVCGSTDGRVFIYALQEGKRSIAPTQTLNHATKSPIQAVAVS